ncbi:MAG: lipopolysaccharide biosynthesis protein [Hydrogenophilales bacterium 16-64-40]|nr:MAG: lipopolysaccharide biosynthesis protein [Hydrogenophilales bacterium 16-64-40]
MNENNSPVIASEAKQSSMPEDDEISLLDILQVVAENARLLILGPLLIGLAALGWAYTITPTFTATTRIMTPQQQQSSASAALAQLGALAGMAGAAAADTYIALLKSRTLADRMIDRFKLMDVYKAQYREDARNALGGATRASAGKDGMITIEVDDHDPKRAAAMANAYVEELARLNGSLALTEAQQRRQFFERELAKAKANLVRAETALGGAGVSESVLKFNPEAMGEGIATLKAQVVAKEVQLASMRGYLTANSPDFRQAQQELAALRAQLAKAARNPPSGGNADYINRYREFKYNEVLFEQLARQYELAKIDESREGTVIQVVDTAEPPERKSKPKKAQIAMLATLASGIVLLLFVFVRRALQNAGQDPESAAKLAAVRAGFGRALKP